MEIENETHSKCQYLPIISYILDGMKKVIISVNIRIERGYIGKKIMIRFVGVFHSRLVD